MAPVRSSQTFWEANVGLPILVGFLLASVCASKALWGACRSIRMEYPSLYLKCVQTDEHMDETQMAQYLVTEMHDKESTTKEVIYQNCIGKK